MKKKMGWVTVSLGLIASISNAQEKQNCESSNGMVSSAEQVQVNADGSVHVFGPNGKSIYLNPKILNLIKSVNPGAAASFIGSTPCVGSAVNDKNKTTEEK